MADSTVVVNNRSDVFVWQRCHHIGHLSVFSGRVLVRYITNWKKIGKLHLWKILQHNFEGLYLYEAGSAT